MDCVFRLSAMLLFADDRYMPTSGMVLRSASVHLCEAIASHRCRPRNGALSSLERVSVIASASYFHLSAFA